MFPKAEPRETLRFKRNKINGFLRDQSLRDWQNVRAKRRFCYIKVLFHILHFIKTGAKKIVCYTEDFGSLYRSSTVAGKCEAGNSLNLAVMTVVSQHSQLTVHCYPLTSQILQCCLLSDFGRKKLQCYMSCDLKVTKRAHAIGEKFPAI